MTRPRHGALSRAVSAHFSLSPRLSARPLQQEGGFSPDTIPDASIHAWRGSTVSTKVDTYQQLRRMTFGQIAGTCRRLGGSGCRGVSAMGPRHASGGLGRTPNPGLAVCAGQRTRASGDRAYRDVLAASPATGPTLPPRRKPAVAVALASAGAGRSPASPLRRTAGPGVVPAAAARPWFPVRRRNRSMRRCCRSRDGRAG